jgi:hypothetical protein
VSQATLWNDNRLPGPSPSGANNISRARGPPIVLGLLASSGDGGNGLAKAVSWASVLARRRLPAPALKNLLRGSPGAQCASTKTASQHRGPSGAPTFCCRFVETLTPEITKTGAIVYLNCFQTSVSLQPVSPGFLLNRVLLSSS